MWMFVAWIVLSILQYALAKARQSKVASKGPGEIQSPIAEQGSPIAYVAGTMIIKGANTIRVFAQNATRNGEADPWRYHCNMDLALCWGEAKLLRVCSGEKWGTLKETARYRNDGATSHVAFTATMGTAVFPENGQYETVTCKLPSLALGNPSLAANVRKRGVHMFRNSIQQGFWSLTGTIAVCARSRAITAIGMDIVDGSRVFAIEPQLIDGVWYIDPFDETNPYSYHSRYDATDTNIPVGAYCYVSKVLDSVPNEDGEPQEVDEPLNWPWETWYRWDGSAWKPTVSALTMPVDSIDYKIEIGKKDSASSVEISGKAIFFPGTQTQGTDLRWKDENGVGPNFPGLCHIVLYGGTGNPNDDTTSVGKFSWGMSPSLPDIAFEVQRFPVIPGIPSIHTRINSTEANPAAVIYELLNNGASANEPHYGLGVPQTKIDVASFLAAASTLYAERIGISLLLDKANSFDSIVEDILKTIDGALYEDPQTGLWTLDLVRQDYDPGDLLHITADDYLDGSAPEYTRSSWGDVANDVRVAFTSRANNYRSAQVGQQNPANLQRVGEQVTVNNTYNAVTIAETAYLLAARDLRVISYPLAKGKLKLNRRGWKLRPVSAFLLTDPELRISGMACRVVKIGYGTPQDPGITVEFCEDVFGTPSTVYNPPATVDPNATVLPANPSAVALFESPYYQTMGYYWALEDRLVSVLAARGSEETSGLKILTDDTQAGTFAETGFPSGSSNGYSPYGLLSYNLSIEERTDSLQLQGTVDFDKVSLDAHGNNFLMIGGEIMSFASMGFNEDGTVTLYTVLRGVLDTIPASHVTGAAAWVITSVAWANYPYTAEGKHNVKAIGYNDVAEMNAGAVAAVSISTVSRTFRPWVPGKFRTNGKMILYPSAMGAYGTVFGNELSFSFEERNRKTQVGAVPQDQTDVSAPDSVRTCWMLSTPTRRWGDTANRFFRATGPLGQEMVNYDTNLRPTDGAIYGYASINYYAGDARNPGLIALHLEPTVYYGDAGIVTYSRIEVPVPIEAIIDIMLSDGWGGARSYGLYYFPEAFTVSLLNILPAGSRAIKLYDVFIVGGQSNDQQPNPVQYSVSVSILDVADAERTFEPNAEDPEVPWTVAHGTTSVTLTDPGTPGVAGWLTPGGFGWDSTWGYLPLCVFVWSVDKAVAIAGTGSDAGQTVKAGSLEFRQSEYIFPCGWGNNWGALWGGD